MPENAEKRIRHTPLVAVETETLSREEWLAYRRQGIGGSDVAGIMGISPFRTARDIYYDKLNKKIAQRKGMRRKLGKFLDCHFQ